MNGNIVLWIIMWHPVGKRLVVIKIKEDGLRWNFYHVNWFGRYTLDKFITLAPTEIIVVLFTQPLQSGLQTYPKTHHARFYLSLHI